MSDTQTPRTDKALEDRGEPRSGLVWGDFARTLERENQQLRDALQRIRNYPVHSEPVGGAMAMQDIAYEALAAYKSLSQNAAETK